LYVDHFKVIGWITTGLESTFKFLKFLVLARLTW